MIRICCPGCRSEEVYIDAAASWDVEAQDWKLSSVQDTLTCAACGEEFYQSAGETPVAPDSATAYRDGMGLTP